MNNFTISQLAWHEQFLAHIELSPWHALYRIGIGATIVPIYVYLFDSSSHWQLILWFVCILISLRLIPAILRKVLPFSRSLKSIWSERRALAKRLDSYQWQKLLWIGIGMGGSDLILDQKSTISTALTVFCLLSGTIGLFVYRHWIGSSKDEPRVSMTGPQIP